MTWIAEPRLRRPVMVCAFAGWNDAGDAATSALRYLIDNLGARKFATLDAEPYYDFSSVRPQVVLDDVGQRSIVWPEVELFGATAPGSTHDLVLVQGIEPQLRWKGFCRQFLEVANRLGVELVITLGALLADVPHTRAVTIIGTAADPDVIARYGLQRSHYEGPTGIVGVLHDACSTAGLASASLWAAVPTYAHSTRSPKAARALVAKAAEMLDATVSVVAMDGAVARYEAEVTAAVDSDPDLSSYVARLEAMADDDDDNDDDEPMEEPSAEQLVAEVEQFLRDHQGDG